MINADSDARLRRSLRRWRIIAAGTAALLVATVAWSMHAGLDQGKTLAYLEGDFKNLQRTELLLERVVLRVSSSTTKAELLNLLGELGAEPFEKQGAVHADGLNFYFTPADTLACVTSSYPPPQSSPCGQFSPPEV
jgi:hypothetical protein